jgi:hypothetical protein
LLIAIPVAFVIIFTLVILYWYVLDRNKKNERFANTFDAPNATLLLMACGLTLAALGIYHTEGEVTQFGFPTPIVTFYDDPISPEIAGTWRVALNQMAINPLQGILNIVLYFLLLKASRIPRRDHHPTN